MKQKVSVKTKAELAEVVELLENFVSSLKEGVVSVESGDKAIMLQPGSSVYLELSASRKSKKEKFSLEVAWKTNPEEKPSIRVSSDEVEENFGADEAEEEENEEEAAEESSEEAGETAAEETAEESSEEVAEEASEESSDTTEETAEETAE